MVDITDVNLVLDEVREALTSEDWDRAIALVEALRPPDQADVFEELSPDTQSELLPRLNPEDSADILEELSPQSGLKTDIIEKTKRDFTRFSGSRQTWQNLVPWLKC